MPRDMSAPQSSPVNKGKILVVDDELDIREGLELLLTSEGYGVELAQNGTEGLQKLERQGYDLVLLDLMMPDLTGMDVLREVRGATQELVYAHAETIPLLGSAQAVTVLVPDLLDVARHLTIIDLWIEQEDRNG